MALLRLAHRRAACTAAIAAVLFVPARAQRQVEYEVKADFIYSFTQFVDWPAATWTDRSAPFRICIVGTDPFGALIDRTVRNERSQGHAFVVDRVGLDADLNGCQIVFMATQETSRAAAVLKSISSKSTLTIGESIDFLHATGAVAFVVDGGRVRFDVNPRSPQVQDLRISSKLLRVARDVWRPERP